MIPRELKPNEVEFEFTPEEEDIHPSDSFQFPEDIAFACSGDPAAWFCAKMTAKWNDLEGVTYLGGCSYNSFKEFLEQEGEQLRSEALEDLNRQIAAVCKKLEGLV